MLGMFMDMMAQAAAAGLTWIGATGSYFYGDSNNGYTARLDLPAGTLVGDVALLTINVGMGDRTSPLVVEGVTGLVEVLSAAPYAPTPSNVRVAVYLHEITAADITAGQLLPHVAWPSAAGAIEVFRGASMSPGVAGATSGRFLVGNSTNMLTATGITTLVDGSVVVMLSLWGNGNSVPGAYELGTPPSGFSKDFDGSWIPSMPLASAYRVPTVAGATGDLTQSLTLGTNGNPSYWGAVLVSIKPAGALTPFALTGTFPEATVGVPWTGVLTFTGDYTGPVAMDVAAGTKPAWIGTPVVDEIAKTATYSGTPDAATSISFTPRATPAVGTPATAPQTFAVAAAASGPTLVQVATFARSGIGSALSAVLDNVAVGDIIVVVHESYSSNPTWAWTFNDSAGNAYVTKESSFGGRGAVDIVGAQSTASVAGSSVTVSAGYVGHSINGAITVYQYRVASAVVWDGASYTDLQPDGTTINSSPYAVSAGSAVIVAASAYSYGQRASSVVSAPQPLTLDTTGAIASSSLDSEAWHYTASAAATGQTIAFSSTATYNGWRLTYVTAIVS